MFSIVTSQAIADCEQLENDVFCSLRHKTLRQKPLSENLEAFPEWERC